MTLQAPSILNLPVMVSDLHPRSFHPEWAPNMDVLLPNPWHDTGESLNPEVSQVGTLELLYLLVLMHLLYLMPFEKLV